KGLGAAKARVIAGGVVPTGTAELGPIQPISANAHCVRSTSVRSPLMKGSINRSGVSGVSQCETEDPDSIGFGAYMRGRPSASVPASCELSRPIEANTPAPPSCPLMAVASACETLTTGIVIEGSLPPIAGGVPATLFPMMTAIAPAACAAAALNVKEQVPRSISAIFPTSAAAFTMGSHASLVVPTPSFTRTTCAWSGGLGGTPPKAAVP